jgi:hypothetical protein
MVTRHESEKDVGVASPRALIHINKDLMINHQLKFKVCYFYLLHIKRSHQRHQCVHAYTEHAT